MLLDFLKSRGLWFWLLIDLIRWKYISVVCNPSVKKKSFIACLSKGPNYPCAVAVFSWFDLAFTVTFNCTGLHYTLRRSPFLSTPSQFLLSSHLLLSLWRSEVIKAKRLQKIKKERSQHTESRLLWCPLQKKESAPSSDLLFYFLIFFFLWGLLRRLVEASVVTRNNLLSTGTCDSAISNVNNYNGAAVVMNTVIFYVLYAHL